ncbi:acetoacetate--CoA ligase [Profundibacter sp.]
MPAPAATSHIVWSPSAERIRASAIDRFRRLVNRRTDRHLVDSTALHRWSLDDPARFYALLWEFLGLQGDPGERVITPGARLEETRFFPDARLSFAANLLGPADQSEAIVFRREDGQERRLTRRALHREVARLQQALERAGLSPGDHVAAYLPNCPEAVILLLACASIGVVFASASPDYGVSGSIDRFSQIRPRLLFACDGYCYNGKAHKVGAKVAAIARGLGDGLEATVIVPFLDTALALPDTGGPVHSLADFTAAGTRTAPRLPLLPFDQPLYILFSSGTTGRPKAIVHRAGVLLGQAKEHQLHCDIRPGDRVFYFSTLSWMVWNWHVACLASGATLMLYDGAPFHPSPDVLWDYAAQERFTLFGTSARYLDALRNSGLVPARGRDLSALRMVASTGSPLAPVNYHFVHEHIRRDVHLASMSGGTDIVGAFVTGDPTRPVRDGEIQGPALGMAMQVVDESARPLPPGQRGELVCATPFPSMPLGFLNDPDGRRYRAAYFERFRGLWHHGDFAETTEHGGFVIHGRSDATLNAGGVRIGTAEIYTQVEKLPEVTEALAIGQERGHDTRIVLFVQLEEGIALDPALEQRIRRAIREGASPRHVPELILAAPDLPRTMNGKIVELAVREVVHGRPVANTDALANPEALDFFAGLRQLRQEQKSG